MLSIRVFAQARHEEVVHDLLIDLHVNTLVRETQAELLSAEVTALREENDRIKLKKARDNAEVARVLRHLRNKVDALNHNFVGDSAVPFVPVDTDRN